MRVLPAPAGAGHLRRLHGSITTRPLTLGLAHHDHPAVKIHVLDPQAQAFHQPHAGAVQQVGEQGYIGWQR
jgi:hypothetical protein